MIPGSDAPALVPKFCLVTIPIISLFWSKINELNATPSTQILELNYIATAWKHIIGHISAMLAQYHNGPTAHCYSWNN